LFKIIAPAPFLRQARKFFKKHPDMKPLFTEKIDALITDPFNPSLKLHPLKGRLAGLYAVSLIYSYRITLTLAISEKEITLLDIGSHDEVY